MAFAAPPFLRPCHVGRSDAVQMLCGAILTGLRRVLTTGVVLGEEAMRIISILTLLIVFCCCAVAQASTPGDSITLVKRNTDIPAHPAPGDSSVHFRFASGSAATVVRLDQQTGWVEIRGMTTPGGQSTGWITTRYIVGATSGSGTPRPSVAWCPPKRSPNRHASGRLRIATWNLGNLYAQDG
jgi:hypothetical protein